MSDRFFLDTNIVVYSFDRRDANKQRRARELIERAMSGEGAVSTQVVQEFLNVATRKFAVPLSAEDCKQYLDAVLAPICEVFSSIALYRSALGLCTETGFAFYDSLILAAALQAGCATLYSEDLQHERRVRDVTIVNPFRPPER